MCVYLHVHMHSSQGACEGQRTTSRDQFSSTLFLSQGLSYFLWAVCVPRLAGLSVYPRLAGLSVDPRLAGLSVYLRLTGLFVYLRLAGLCTQASCLVTLPPISS